ncbi:MAG: cation:proton antiporter [Oscillospiraceae bacterium]
MVFAVSFGIAKALNTGSFDVISIVVDPLIEIVCSLALGALGGWVLTQLEKLFNSNTNRLNMTIAFVFLTSALAMAEFKIGPVTIGFSSLLTCMMLGTLFCNLCPLSGEIMEKADRWTSPLFAAFFVISGAGLDLGVFKDGMIVLIGVVYILTRSLGKYLGAHYSAKLMKCEPQICKYLGITLLPQAGVALGMCVTARQLGAEGDLIRNITLFAILIYELVGPLLTKMALQAAGEIHPMEDAVKNRRQINLEKANAEKK